jgi:hypothetical protein
MPGQTTYQYRPYTLRGQGGLVKPRGENRAPALPEAGAARGRISSGLRLENIASVLRQLLGIFMRCLAIGGRVSPPSPGEHMPLRLPDACSRTAWAGRPSGTTEAGPGELQPTGRAS